VEVKTGRPVPLRYLAIGAALGACGCFGTGSRRFDAPCREMRGSVVREMLRDSPEIPVLDVRTSWNRKLTGAILIPLPELAERVGELSRNKSTPLVVVGDDGAAGRQACESLSAAGFKYVIYVPEGADGLFAGVRGAGGPGDGPGEPQ
jgi:rhodanese-related sulfurtransferase